MLPDFGWTELLVIAIVLIVVVGPKDLPKMLRTFGQATKSLRRMAGDFRKQFDDALKEAELDDVRDIAKDLKGLDPRNAIKETLSPLGKIGEDLNDDLKRATKDMDSARDPKSAAEKALDTTGGKVRAAQAKADPSAAVGKPGKKTSRAKPTASKPQPASANGATPSGAKPAPKKRAAKTAAATPPAAKKPSVRTSAAKAPQPAKTGRTAKPRAKKPAAIEGKS